MNKNLEMSRIKKTSPLLNLSNFQTFIVDNNPLSQYFKISELGDLLTAGKNGFLIEGSTFLKPSTEIKIEVLDTEGNPLFVEPGEGIPEYYEGLSKLIGVYVYEDTPIGIGKITILGELDTWLDENGFPQPIPEDWAGIYNVKWERDIKINKNIPNETRVRFVRRPEIIIEELNESFYSRNLVNATQTDGLVRGIALTPTEGTTLRGYRGGIRYLVQKQSGGFLDGGTFISVTGTGIQNAEVVEYLNSSSVVVATPFTSSDGLVSNFSGKNYSLSYQYNQNPVASSILGSFGRFEINHLQTFVGDVERIKVFKKSRASNVDYEVIQDTRVESSEILTAIVSGSAIDVGHFSASYENGQSWNSFWTTQSNAGNILDSSKIYRAVKLKNNRLSTNLGDDIRLESGSEYALEFYNYYDTSSNNPSDKLNVYLTSTLRSGSGISNYYLTQSLAVLTGSNEFRSANKRVYNFIPPITDNWTINFESSNTTANSYWHVGSVSLKAAHELGFSPDEFNFIIPIDRDLERETFDFKFEFFDINNNYVPITVTSAKTFQSGNIGLIDKNIIVDTDKQFFNFSSSLEASPLTQTINIVGTKNRILGNLLITSQAFDTGGIEIPTSSYLGSVYPGKLSGSYEDLYSFSASLSVADFSGSLHPTTIVDRITYTLTEVESVQPFIKRFTINRLVAGASGADGNDAKFLSVSANTNQFIYEPTGPSLKPTGQTILIDVRKQNLITGSLTANSSSGAPTLTLLSSDVNGVSTYRLNGSSYSYSIGEKIYAFTGSDEFSNIYYDSIKITPVMNFDGVSVVLTNEATSFPASSSGAVNSSLLSLGNGSVNVRVGSNIIPFVDGNASANSFDIQSVTGTNCTPLSASPSTNLYGISAIDSNSESASLNLTIKYLAGDNQTSASFSKVVSYSKSKKAAPVLNFNIVNGNQSTDARSTGVQVGTFLPITMSIADTYDGVTTRRLANSLTATSIPTNAVIFGKTVSNEFITASLADNFDSGDINLNGTVVDSEGTTRNISGSISLSKVKKAAPILTISTTNNAQSVSAKSTGAQIDAFSNATVTVSQLYNGTTTNLTITTLTATSSDIASISTTPASGLVTLNGKTLADGTNSTTVAISATVTDSEGTTRTLTDTITLSKVKKAVPLVVVSATPQAQSVLANAAGTQTGTLSNVTISALEGTTSRFTSMAIASSTGFSTAPTVSSNTLTMTSAVMNAAEASVTLTVTHTDSEGTSGQTQTIIIRATKVPTGAKGDTGDAGSNGSDGRRTATGIVYYQLSAGSAPSTPLATSFTFSTAVFSGLTANWGVGAPTFAAGNSNKYWYSTYTAVESSAGSNTATPTFTTPVQAIGFTGLVTFTSANNITDGTNTSNIVPSGSITNHIGGANVTTINGGRVSTGVITSTGYTLPGGDTLASGTYTTAGTIFNLDNGSLRSKNFYINSAGDAFFRGNLSAAGGTFAGQITVGGTDYNTSEFLNSNTTKSQVGLGNVSNLGPQAQAETGIKAGTTIDGGGITISGGGSIKGGQSDFNTGTGFFLGYSGAAYKFSIGNAGSKGITWDGSTLSIGGDVNIGGTLATTVTSGAAAGASAVQPGANVSTLNNDAGFQNATNVNNASKTAGSVGGWTINSDSIRGNSPTGGGDGSYTTNAGIILSSAGWISSKNFYIDSTGNAAFRGTLTGASGTFGDCTIDTFGITFGNFRLSSSGMIFVSYNYNSEVQDYSMFTQRLRLYQNTQSQGGHTHSLTFDTINTGTGTTMVINASGYVLKTSSSRKYKTDIQTLDLNYAKRVLDLNVVKFKDANEDDANEYEDNIHTGLIAEDVHDLNYTDWVIYDKNGEVDGLYYQSIFSSMLKVVQDLNKRVEELEAKISGSL